MRYRIKTKEGYVCGDDSYWAKIDNVSLEEITIFANSSETFILEWYWLDDGRHDDEDTYIGLKGSAVYVINIKLISELK